MEITQQIVEILCEEFGEDFRDALSPDAGPEDIETWDSISAMRVLLSLERAFRIRISMDEAAEMTTVGKIGEAVERPVAARSG